MTRLLIGQGNNQLDPANLHPTKVQHVNDAFSVDMVVTTVHVRTGSSRMECCRYGQTDENLASVMSLVLHLSVSVVLLVAQTDGRTET